MGKSVNCFFRKAVRYVKDRGYRFSCNNKMGFYRRLPDEVFLQKLLKEKYGKNADIKNPVTFNEKMQWLKLHDRNPLYVRMVDKYLVREHVAGVIGEEHLIPLLGVWENADDIDFNLLPEQFVLKCNHNSGKGAYICKDKKTLDEKRVRINLKKGLREDYYMAVGREWPYKGVPRRIIAEKYISDESDDGLKDYKFFTFSGQVHYIEVIYNKDTKPYCSFYTKAWKYVPISMSYPTNKKHWIKKPDCLEEMIETAEKLAASIGAPAFLRVDLYNIDNLVYFGEFTFYHNSGGDRIHPEDYDKKLGDLIKLE